VYDEILLPEEYKNTKIVTSPDKVKIKEDIMKHDIYIP
jgi:hypothetical protein